jgi:NADH:ubiquinone reductase (H+-translocating)
MSTNNIVIAGGGFAGVSALKRLCRFKKVLSGDMNLILLDKKENFEFLPMLPDIVGGWVRPEALRVSLKKICGSHNCEFINDEITGIDTVNRKVILVKDIIDYEYLLISGGSETDFFNNENAQKNCFKLDSVDDALILREEILKRAGMGGMINIVVAGGGYTGIESATNINYLLRGKKPDIVSFPRKRESRKREIPAFAGMTSKYKIYIVEKEKEILKPLPGRIKKEVNYELRNLGIKVIPADSLLKYDAKTVLLRSGKKIGRAVCLWSAGVKTPSFTDGLNVEKERTRINVTDGLKIKSLKDNNIFAAGDTAYFFDRKINSGLRMAVMFSMGQGKTAAFNIMNSILKKPLKKYKPVDLGYIVPMAHGRASGVILGRRAGGRLAYMMHYAMCVYRSEWSNKMAVMKSVLMKSQII